MVVTWPYAGSDSDLGGLPGQLPPVSRVLHALGENHLLRGPGKFQIFVERCRKCVCVCEKTRHDLATLTQLSGSNSPCREIQWQTQCESKHPVSSQRTADSEKEGLALMARRNSVRQFSWMKFVLKDSFSSMSLNYVRESIWQTIHLHRQVSIIVV